MIFLDLVFEFLGHGRTFPTFEFVCLYKNVVYIPSFSFSWTNKQKLGKYGGQANKHEKEFIDKKRQMFSLAIKMSMFVMTLSRRMNIYVIAFPSMAIIFAKLAYTQEEFQIQKSCLLTDSFIFGLRIDLFLVYNICL